MNPLQAIKHLQKLTRNITGELSGGKKKEEEKKTKKQETAEKGSVREKAGKGAKRQKAENAAEHEKAGKSLKQKAEKAAKQQKTEKAAKQQKAENAAKQQKAEKAAKQQKAENAAKQQKTEKAAKQQKTEKAAKQQKTEKTAKQQTAVKAAEPAAAAEPKPARRRSRRNEPEADLLRKMERLDFEDARTEKALSVNVKRNAKVKIIPLGGLEQIGMNITAFEYGDSIIVVDCGLAFPSDDMPGIDLVIPDVTYLKDNISRVKGFFITHGHEDHIGALPYVLREVNVPVYSTRLTIALIRHKLEEHGLLDSAKLNVVKHGDTVTVGDFSVEFVKTNHSISDSSALAIFSPAGILFHTGDFKIDYTPVFGEAADLQRMAELGKMGVLALLCDSTNAIRSGFTMSERTVGHTFDVIFSEHPKNRIIVATFASNVDRVQQVINTASRYGRKVVVEGRSMVNVIGIANELGYIHIPEGTLIDIEELKNYPQEKTVLITTGSQGESMAALSRMANGTHKKVHIETTDVVVMSSHPIPGNEKAVDRVINELSIRGAEVIFQDTHVSGHACAEEIKLMYSLLRPRFSIPVHGEYRHRKAQMAIAEAVGVPHENVIFMSTGDVAELTPDSWKITGKVQAGGIMVDGLGVGDVGSVVLRDRQMLSQNGIIIVTLVLDRAAGELASGPDIVSRGFVYVKESEVLIEDARAIAEHSVRRLLEDGVTDWSRIRSRIRDDLSDLFWKTMKRTPVIIPIIMGVN